MDDKAPWVVLQHQLWMLLARKDGYRAAHVTWFVFDDNGNHGIGRAWETEGPKHTDVPISVASKMHPDDEGADAYWREAVYRFWKARDRCFRQLEWTA